MPLFIHLQWYKWQSPLCREYGGAVAYARRRVIFCCRGWRHYFLTIKFMRLRKPIVRSIGFEGSADFIAARFIWGLSLNPYWNSWSKSLCSWAVILETFLPAQKTPSSFARTVSDKSSGMAFTQSVSAKATKSCQLFTTVDNYSYKSVNCGSQLIKLLVTPTVNSSNTTPKTSKLIRLTRSEATAIEKP